jgi:hypothetical protein
MKLVLMTYSNVQDYKGECECALLDVDRALVQKLEYFAAAARRLKDELGSELSSVQVHFHVVTYYSSDLLAACYEASGQFESEFETQLRAALPVGIDLSRFEPERVDFERLEVFPFDDPEFWWNCRACDDVDIEVDGVKLSEFQQLVAAMAQ